MKAFSAEDAKRGREAARRTMVAIAVEKFGWDRATAGRMAARWMKELENPKAIRPETGESQRSTDRMIRAPKKLP